MSYRRRHRWFRRMVLGLAFATVVFAGRTSVAAAKFDEGTSGSRYVSAGGWSGLVDIESGIPLSAGIPHGDEPFVDEQEVMVIPYLSHGILTEEDAQAATAEAIHDPYLTDVFVRPGESLGGPDGEQVAIENALDAQATAAAEAIHDPYLTDVFVRPGESLGGPDGREAVEKSTIGQSGISSDEIAFANAVVAAADALHDPVTAEEQARQEPVVIPYLSHGILGESVKSGPEQGTQVIPYLSHGILTEEDAQAAAAEAIRDPNLGRLDGDEIAVANAIESKQVEQTPYMSLGLSDDGKLSEPFIPGVTDFPRVSVDLPAVRPDDLGDRFAHSDVPVRAELATDSGSGFEWNDALTVGIGGVVLAIGLGLAFGYLRRPRLAL